MPSARALRVMCLANVSSSPASASATTTAASLADLVTSALIASSTSSVWPGRTPSLVGACEAASEEHRHLRVELDFAGLKLLEQHVERHDLGQRRRVPQAVGAGFVQRLAGLGVDHVGGVPRAGGDLLVRLRLVDLGVVILFDVALAAGAGVGRIGGDRQRRHHGDQTQSTPAKPPRGPGRHANHARTPFYAWDRRSRVPNPLEWLPRAAAKMVREPWPPRHSGRTYGDGVAKKLKQINGKCPKSG